MCFFLELEDFREEWGDFQIDGKLKIEVEKLENLALILDKFFSISIEFQELNPFADFDSSHVEVFMTDEEAIQRDQIQVYCKVAFIIFYDK